MAEKPDYERLRKFMVEHQIRARGIKNERVLSAFLKVPREEFVSNQFKSSAYDDCPLPIDYSQTISQPYMVAIMTELTNPEKDDRVLEIGTGSGYQTAILCELGCRVFSVEKIPELAERAKKILEKLGYNANIMVGDGTLGWEQYAPYKIIIVTAGAPDIPQSLIEQLDEGGRIIIPVGTLYSQDLIRAIKKKGKLIQENHGGCQFVPLKGKEGWE
ncbi:MAG TPA: protein-L-isoaspartate(D-aspartate) O-methyltransferase [bacterium]|nr:protein-L-isoaspartate(D-aspartate) O-methyltransferase [bacterium]HOL49296.1 protein-L-isoaspartate(D-aspartate) O-methyltransferase [bacterium]HPO51383.1 protein-L-isoaspartate(D-aspartate) O-methyltransferase [bacterium]HXK44430.1 protein-L-isoaspartate(D-aspartate) O-methyltransferase [bacterium]